MNGPVALLHVVGSENIAHFGQLVEEVILEAEHGGRPDNGGLGVDFADDLLTPRLYIIRTLASCILAMYVLTLVAKYSEGESRRAL